MFDVCALNDPQACHCCVPGLATLLADDEEIHDACVMSMICYEINSDVARLKNGRVKLCLP
jgi:hypothetical protein